MRPLHIVVTGASGFIGTRLIRYLAATGHSGVAVSRRELQNLPRGWSWAPRAQVLADGLPERGPGPADWLVHLEVKQHVVSPQARDVQEFEAVNANGTGQWLEWCAEQGIKRSAYFSSIKAVADSNECQDETAAGAPATPYGASKRAGEDRLAAWVKADSSRTGLILRPAVVVGPGNAGNLFALVRAIDQRRFFLVGPNRNIKSLVTMANVAASVEFLLRREEPGLEVFNLVNGTSISVREIAGIISRELGVRAPRTLPVGLAWVAAWSGDVLQRMTGRSAPLSSGRLRALLEMTHFSAAKLAAAGFVHPQTTEEGLIELVRWYREEVSAQ